MFTPAGPGVMTPSRGRQAAGTPAYHNPNVDSEAEAEEEPAPKRRRVFPNRRSKIVGLQSKLT